MISNQQLYKQIPKLVNEWTVDDVNKWFKINDIQIPQQIQISGKQFMQLTPSKLINQLRLSNFLTRKISDWIQFQISDFQEYIQQVKGSVTEENDPKQDFLRQKKLLNEVEINMMNMKSHKSEQNCNHSEPVQLCKVKSSDGKNINQSQVYIQQAYEPLKYKARRQPQKKNIFFDKESRIESSKKEKQFFNKKQQERRQLVLKNLIQNSQDAKQDSQTCKNIPEKSQYFGDLKSIPSSKKFYKPQSSVSSVEGESYQNNVKFISSQLMHADSCILTAQFDNNIIQITKPTKIGRSTLNDIVLKSDGVSRNHAEIIISEKVDQEGNNIKVFFLKDSGSKFGTYIEVDPQKPKKVFEGQFLCIGETVIRIDKLKIAKNKQKFDATISIIQNQQEQRSYFSRSIVTIGNKKKDENSKEGKSSQITKRSSKQRQKQKRDLQLQDMTIKNYHCRFTIVNGQIYLQQVEGNILQKIQKHIQFQLIRRQYQVKFGDQNVLFKFDHIYRPFRQFSK